MKDILRPILALLAGLLLASQALAETQTVTATGEHRMGRNDSRVDAKRLAYYDGKRRALEEAGRQLSTVPEIQQAHVTPDELIAYLAGILDVAELVARTSSDGDVTIVRVDVTARYEPERVAKKVTAVHESESIRLDLVTSKEEVDRLRETITLNTKELNARTSKNDLQPLIEERERLLTKLEANGFVARARAALMATEDGAPVPRDTTAEERAHAKSLLDRALSLDPSHAKAHGLMGTILLLDKDVDEAWRQYRAALKSDPSESKGHVGSAAILRQRGDLDGAIAELQSAVRVQPTNAMAHYNLAMALQKRRKTAGAVQEYREFLKLVRDVPPNRPLITTARSALQDLERQPSKGCASTAHAGTVAITSEVESFDLSLLLLPLMGFVVLLRKRATTRFRRCQQEQQSHEIDRGDR